MPNDRVPGKIYRHILKALDTLNTEEQNLFFLYEELIIQQVKKSTRRLLPVPNIRRVIKLALKNLTNVGVLEKRGYGYALRPKMTCCVACSTRLGELSMADHSTTNPDRTTPNSNEQNEEKQNMPKIFSTLGTQTGNSPFSLSPQISRNHFVN